MSETDRTPSQRLSIGNRQSDPHEATPTAAGRRKLLKMGTLLCVLGVHHLASAQSSRGQRGVVQRNDIDQNSAHKGKSGVVAVRVWPSDDYTRITIESDQELTATPSMLPALGQMQIDISDLQLSDQLRNVVTKVQADDPNISVLQISQISHETVRMTISLKQAVRPEIFTLKPIAPYHWRLVFDLYPVNAIDPLEELIAERMHLDATVVAAAPKPTPAPPPPAPALKPPAPVPVPPPHTGRDPLDDWLHKNGSSAPGPAPAPVQPPPPPPPPPPRPPAPAPAPTPPPLPSGPLPNRIIVAIDPGHGGEDPGAIGPGRTREKDIVLSIGLILRGLINQANVRGVPMQAFMTRDRDFFVPLGVRVQKARRVNADIFISIHADGFTNPSARGAGVYALSQRGATSTMARAMADKENQSDLVGGISVNTKEKHVAEVMLDMSTSAQVRDSIQLGTFVSNELAKFAQMHKKQVEQANFAVLRSPDTPSILVETAFITNPQEERMLQQSSYQERLARAILAGVIAYFTKYPARARAR